MSEKFKSPRLGAMQNEPHTHIHKEKETHRERERQRETYTDTHREKTREPESQRQRDRDRNREIREYTQSCMALRVCFSSNVVQRKELHTKEITRNTGDAYRCTHSFQCAPQRMDHGTISIGKVAGRIKPFLCAWFSACCLLPVQATDRPTPA